MSLYILNTDCEHYITVYYWPILLNVTFHLEVHKTILSTVGTDIDYIMTTLKLFLDHDKILNLHNVNKQFQKVHSK